jgi:hypothetical protein
VLPDLRLNEHEAASAVMLDTGDIVFFITGRAEQSPGSSHPEHQTRVLMWEKATRDVVEQGKLRQPRESFRTVLVAGNRVLIAGGYERTSGNVKPSWTTELWDVAQRASIPMAQPDALFAGGSAHPPAPVLAHLPDGRAFVIASGGGAIYDPELDRWTPTRPEFKPATQGAALTTADGRMVTLTKKMGLPVEITLVDLLTGRSRALKAPARQCVRDPALTARSELMAIADDCMPGRPPNVERWQLGKR